MWPDRVLFVGAHADDIELFGGATLSRFVREGVRVHCHVFSTHRSVSDHLQAREECFRSFAEVYGLGSAAFSVGDLGACNGEFQAERGTIYRQLAQHRDGWRPAWVVTHSPRDTNQDHQQVAAEVIRVFKGAATILHGEFLNNDIGDQPRSLYIEITEEDVERKIRALDLYSSQQINDRPYFTPALVRARALTLGAQIGTALAEVFSPTRLVFRLEPPTASAVRIPAGKEPAE